MKKVEFHKIYLTNLITNTLKALLKTRSKIRFPRGHVGSANHVQTITKFPQPQQLSSFK